MQVWRKPYIYVHIGADMTYAAGNLLPQWKCYYFQQDIYFARSGDHDEDYIDIVVE